MTCTTYQCWRNDGSPWSDCQPTRDLIAMLQRYGYTGPTVGIGDQSHLTASPPEDHTPYSHTPWPGAQPYPRILAIDIMPNEGIDIIDLGSRLFNDKNSAKPGTEPIKYMNWTDSAGNCWHDSWQPNHTRYASSDRGHIHISWRTDYVSSTIMQSYDPYGGGGTSMLCKFGDTNENVRAMQSLLLQVDPGCLPQWGADANYGQETANAMSRIVTGGPGRDYNAAAYATLFAVLAKHFAGGGSGPATLVPHDHPVSVSVSVTGSGSGTGRTGAATPTS